MAAGTSDPIVLDDSDDDVECVIVSETPKSASKESKSQGTEKVRKGQDKVGTQPGEYIMIPDPTDSPGSPFPPPTSPKRRPASPTMPSPALQSARAKMAAAIQRPQYNMDAEPTPMCLFRRLPRDNHGNGNHGNRHDAGAKSSENDVSHGGTVTSQENNNDVISLDDDSDDDSPAKVTDSPPADGLRLRITDVRSCANSSRDITPHIIDDDDDVIVTSAKVPQKRTPVGPPPNTPNGPATYKCAQCSQTFEFQDNLDLHKVLHRFEGQTRPAEGDIVKVQNLLANTRHEIQEVSKYIRPQAGQGTNPGNLHNSSQNNHHNNPHSNHHNNHHNNHQSNPHNNHHSNPHNNPYIRPPAANPGVYNGNVNPYMNYAANYPYLDPRGIRHPAVHPAYRQELYPNRTVGPRPYPLMARNAAPRAPWPVEQRVARPGVHGASQAYSAGPVRPVNFPDLRTQKHVLADRMRQRFVGRSQAGSGLTPRYPTPRPASLVPAAPAAPRAGYGQACTPGRDPPPTIHHPTASPGLPAPTGPAYPTVGPAAPPAMPIVIEPEPEPSVNALARSLGLVAASKPSCDTQDKSNMADTDAVIGKSSNDAGSISSTGNHKDIDTCKGSTDNTDPGKAGETNFSSGVCNGSRTLGTIEVALPGTLYSSSGSDVSPIAAPHSVISGPQNGTDKPYKDMIDTTSIVDMYYSGVPGVCPGVRSDAPLPPPPALKPGNLGNVTSQCSPEGRTDRKRLLPPPPPLVYHGKARTLPSGVVMDTKSGDVTEDTERSAFSGRSSRPAVTSYKQGTRRSPRGQQESTISDKPEQEVDGDCGKDMTQQKQQVEAEYRVLHNLLQNVNGGDTVARESSPGGDTVARESSPTELSV